MTYQTEPLVDHTVREERPTLHYSAATGAFYDTSSWPHELPADAVEVSPEDHAALLGASAEGKMIRADGKGHPVAVEPPPPTTEALAAQARRRRDAEVSTWRWMIERHRDEIELDQPTTLSPAQFTALLLHVQALRDVPLLPGFPADFVWPALPSELAMENPQ